MGSGSSLGGRGVPKTCSDTCFRDFPCFKCGRYLDGCDRGNRCGHAVASGVFDWRHPGVIGGVGARGKVKEPEGWKDAQKNKNEQAGSYLDLFGDARWRKHALLGMALAAVGLASFWAVGVATQGLAKNMLLAEGVTEAAAASKAKFAYGIVQTVGAGVGLLSFGPLCAWLGRRRAFVFGHIGAFLIVPNVYGVICRKRMTSCCSSCRCSVFHIMYACGVRCLFSGTISQPSSGDGDQFLFQCWAHRGGSNVNPLGNG